MAQNGAQATGKPSKIQTRDVYSMAVRLLAKHGKAAHDVAAFTETEHALRGDKVRTHAWHAVKSTLNDMIEHQLSVDGLRIH